MTVASAGRRRPPHRLEGALLVPDSGRVNHRRPRGASAWSLPPRPLTLNWSRVERTGPPAVTCGAGGAGSARAGGGGGVLAGGFAVTAPPPAPLANDVAGCKLNTAPSDASAAAAATQRRLPRRPAARRVTANFPPLGLIF